MRNFATLMKRYLLTGLLATIGCTNLSAQAASLNGAGATFPYPIYAKWADSYKKKTGVGLNYQSIGSGGGIKQITAKTVDFGASDKPLSQEDLNSNGLLQFPMVMGGVVPVINVPDIEDGTFKLTGPLLADIYLGKITQWNDPAIAKYNAGIKLPDLKITVVARSDGSGTTYIFTHYLSKVSKEWESKIGNNTSVAWPTGVGGKGNEGVASYVKRIKGGIGYVEYAYALQNKMNYAQLQNSAGKFVKPDTASFQAAAANADWKKTPGFALMLTNQPGANSWPITGATFILLHKKQDDAKVAQEVLNFFSWAYHQGDAEAEAMHYVPMPKNVVRQVEATWKKEIRGPKGAPVWTDKPVQK